MGILYIKYSPKRDRLLKWALGTPLRPWLVQLVPKLLSPNHSWKPIIEKKFNAYNVWKRNHVLKRVVGKKNFQVCPFDHGKWKSLSRSGPRVVNWKWVVNLKLTTPGNQTALQNKLRTQSTFRYDLSTAISENRIQTLSVKFGV